MVLKPNAVVDIAKQGLQLQNLTGMWNARVLDGFTPFVVQFKENGLPVNLTDLNAFIEGDIGEGHYDSATDDIVMTGTPKSVRYTDDGSGNTNMGIVVFRLPPQFFIQTGIFKGFIGLQSSTGIRSTSNDVWFKVLGNSYTMGISCKYFISDFQKALDQADGKITQALNDLYNKYNQKAGQAESNLDNFLSTLKNEQKAADDLSMLIKQTNDYINTHNVVTRNEYDKLANEIVTKLGQINVTPNYYKNYDDMVANNPNGTENLCVTADTEHKWLYVNKQWLDLGNFSYAAIDPQLKMAMLTPNTSNVLPNSDFKLDDYWSAASSDGKEYTLENVIERFKSYNGSYYFKVFGDS
ncbi:MAG TPA: phage baseplate upper protein, partial [Lactobacillus johnsonii]|nr:phage baseplate upper protein [Lactobacillus johnsonii]